MFIYYHGGTIIMKQNNSLLAVKIAGNVLKASLILLIISSGLMIYALADSNVSANYHDLSADSTLVTSPLYRESGEKLQYFISLGDEDSQYDNEVMRLHVVIERSLTYSFEESTVVYTADVNGMVRDVTVTEPSYYRMKVTNLMDQNVDFVTANASADLGLVIVLAIAAFLLGISIAAFAVTISLSIVALVFLALFYPLYLVIKNESRSRVYYPDKYYNTVPEQSQDQNVNNNQ